MNFAGGVLRWSADEFWTCPLAYFRAAHEGYALSKGIRKPVMPEMRKGRLKELYAKADAMAAAIRQKEAAHGA